MLHESEELEVCCICLDSLCAQPVAALLSLESDTTSSCLHYMHAACAERLRPRRCPICRSAFDALSTPISKETLQEMNPSDIVAGLCVLSGHHGRAGTVPPRVAVPLLAALLPLRQTTVQKWVEKELVNSEVLNTKAVEQLLRRAGLGRGNARSEGTSASTTYTAQLRIFRRSRWLALKLMGATGAALHLGCCGMAAGVLLGCFGALPNLRFGRFGLLASLAALRGLRGFYGIGGAEPPRSEMGEAWPALRRPAGCSGGMAQSAAGGGSRST